MEGITWMGRQREFDFGHVKFGMLNRHLTVQPEFRGKDWAREEF